MTEQVQDTERQQTSRKATSHYRLKAGSHSTGVGLNARHFHASDPKNNIIESDQNLAAWDPNKFERYEGPIPDQAQAGTEPDEKDLPPGPTTDFQRFQAEAMKTRTPEESKELAKRLREQADALDAQASRSESIRQESGKETKSTPTTATKPGLTPEQQRAQDGRLDQMTVEELRELAEDEEIDLRANMRKDEIIQAIRTARKSAK